MRYILMARVSRIPLGALAVMAAACGPGHLGDQSNGDAGSAPPVSRGSSGSAMASGGVSAGSSGTSASAGGASTSTDAGGAPGQAGAPPTSKDPLDKGVVATVSQVHNAPGWLPGHAYASATGPFTRVVSGPGWNAATGTYNPGRELNAYQLTSAGTCTSGASGAPSDTGAAIQDGTCTWRYLSPVDYISITGWGYDNSPWQSGMILYNNIFVSDTPLRAYMMQDQSCTSTAAPSGVGDMVGSITTSDGCHWQYLADIVYTSKRSYIPTQTYAPSSNQAMIHMNGNYEAQLWNDREYVAGTNSELSPIRTEMHQDYRGDSVWLAGPMGPWPTMILATAPGESFRDSLQPSDMVSGYDPSRGVAIRNDVPYQWPNAAAGFLSKDSDMDFMGLQIKSTQAAALEGMSQNANRLTIRSCILEGGDQSTWSPALSVDTSSAVVNSLIVSHAAIGVAFKYPGFLLHSTVVTPDTIADSTGVTTFNKWVYDDTAVADTAIIGFRHAVGHVEDGTAWSSRSSNNVTDSASGDSGTFPDGWVDNTTLTVDTLPGTTYGNVTLASAFVASGSDWRPAAGSPLRSSGAAFGPFALYCDINTPDCAQKVMFTFDDRDLIGTARPQNGSFDVGALQSMGAP